MKSVITPLSHKMSIDHKAFFSVADNRLIHVNNLNDYSSLLLAL